MTELDTAPDIETTDFIDELSDEALDRTEDQFGPRFTMVTSGCQLR